MLQVVSDIRCFEIEFEKLFAITATFLPKVDDQSLFTGIAGIDQCVLQVTKTVGKPVRINQLIFEQRIFELIDSGISR